MAFESLEPGKPENSELGAMSEEGVGSAQEGEMELNDDDLRGIAGGNRRRRKRLVRSRTPPSDDDDLE